MSSIDLYLNKLTEEDISCFKEALINIIPIVEKYKDQKDIEIEFRLGYLENDRFNSNIPELFFKKIFDKLNNSTMFHNEKREMLDTFNNGLRRTKDLVKNRSTVIKKEKIASFDFSLLNTPFDIRVSISREIKMSIKDFKETSNSYRRHKNRTSFSYKSWSFDLTEISYEENSVKYNLFEVELEIENLKSDINYIIHSSLLKVRDMALFCEDEGPTSFKLMKKYINKSNNDESE